jgi:hypothetical protein
MAAPVTAVLIAARRDSIVIFSSLVFVVEWIADRVVTSLAGGGQCGTRARHGVATKG